MDLILAQSAGGGPSRALSLVILVSVFYLLILRFLDLNEKEPLWAVATFFTLGAVVGLMVHLVVSSRVIVLEPVWGPVVLESARFFAFLLGFGVLLIAERLRGWFEIDGVMDGIVYGGAVGLGVATGGVFVGELFLGGTLVIPVGAFTELWTTALTGLSAGLFGAIIGAGFGYGRRLRGRARSGWMFGLVGLVVAIVAHVLYRLLVEGSVGAGASALARRWVGLAIPLVVLAAAAVGALRRERRAIAALVDDPAEAGVVAPEDRVILCSLLARRRRYASLFVHGAFDEWSAERALHNQQARLALILAHREAAKAEDVRAELDADASILRASIIELRSRRASSGDSAEAGTGHV